MALTLRRRVNRPPRVGRAQAQHLRVLACLRGVLVLRDRRGRPTCVAVLEVAGRPVASLAAHDQVDVFANALGLFGALTHPVQLLVRTEEVSLVAHAEDVFARTRDDAGLAHLGAAYATFARGLAGERRLLRRHCYAVVPADEGLSWPETRAQLTSRCDDLAESLGRLGMPSRRLETDELVALEAAAWRPGAPHAPWASGGTTPGGQERQEGAPAHDVLRRSAALDAVLAGLFREAGSTGGSGAVGTLGAVGRVLARSLVPRPLRPRLGSRVASWLEGAPPDPEALALQASCETLPGRLAPAAVRVYRDAVVLDDGEGEATRTLALTAYPRALPMAWLTPLVTGDALVDVSVHVAPKDDAGLQRSLEHRQARLQAVLNRAAQEGANPDPEVQVAVEDLAQLRDALSRRQARLFDVAMYLHLRAPTRAALGSPREGLQARVQTAMARVSAETRPLVYRQPQGFRAVLPEANDEVRAALALDTASLARSLPFVSGTATGSGILVGTDLRTSGLLLYDLFDPAAPNASLAVVAQAGSGKSYFLKLLALRHRFLGVEVLVLDPEGEYRRLCEAVGGQLVRFAVSRGSHLNPFDLPPVEVDEATGESSDPVTEQAAALGGLLEVLLATPGRLAPDERAALDRAVLAAYTATGIHQGQPATWTLAPPLLRDLHQALEEAGTAASRRLAGLLERYVRSGAFAGVFDRPTDVRLANPFVVFDVLQLFTNDTVPDGLRAAVLQLVTAYVWRTVRQERTPRLFIADEAKTLLQHPDSARFVGEMARRCRKYWLGLCVAVQRLDHLRESPEGLDVLANAGAKFILGHRSEDVGPVVETFALPDADRLDLVAANKGQGLFITRAGRAFVSALASAEEHRLYTTRPDEVAAIEAEDRLARRAGRNGHAAVAVGDRNGDG